ncbi:hypothetical protein [Methanobrevibacter sp. DSM 116169]|uniref:hypothetical protein n=1 Tax=Methanobrevibacter sp. DSM 116169 TaxID=3242727 RepID=UPI0038FCF293
MSVLERNLNVIRNVVTDSEPFQDINFFLHEAEMSANTRFPALSFDVGDRVRQDYSPDCTNYTGELEIRLHTKTDNKEQLQYELYDYEEDLVKVIDFARINNSFDDYNFDLRQTKSSGIGALVYVNKDPKGLELKSLFSNILRVYFEIDYRL